MYRLEDYANMLRDRVRTKAYCDAIDRLVGPESVVLDLGAGTGAFALYAARRGARRIYAVELSPLLDYGRREAERLGLADRIVFHQGRAEDFEVEEKADVLISDLRGALPFLGDAFATLADTRKRLLRPDATVLPTRDRLFVAPVEDAGWYQSQVVNPWLDNPLGIDMPILARAETCTPRRPPARGLAVALPGQCFGEIDYVAGPALPAPAALEWVSEEGCTVHALLLWFEAELLAGIVISAAPGGPAPQVYGRLVLPLAEPLALGAGERLQVQLRVWPLAGDFAYTWCSSRCAADGQVLQALRQHSAHDLFVGVKAA